MIIWIVDRLKWLKWIWNGKTYIKYAGFNCGCCGKWIKKKFKVPKYQSQGKWCDTWGLCEECANSGIDLSGSVPKRANPPVDFDTVECSNGSVMITPKSGD